MVVQFDPAATDDSPESLFDLLEAELTHLGLSLMTRFPTDQIPFVTASRPPGSRKVDRARFELAPAEDGGGQPQNGAHPLCYLHHRSQKVCVKSLSKSGVRRRLWPASTSPEAMRAFSVSAQRPLRQWQMLVFIWLDTARSPSDKKIALTAKGVNAEVLSLSVAHDMSG